MKESLDCLLLKGEETTSKSLNIAALQYHRNNIKSNSIEDSTQ